MKKLKQLAGYCLILPLDEQDQKTSSGLVLPEKAKEKPAKGKVIEVGDPIIHYESQPGLITNSSGVFYGQEKSQVKKGDIVIFHRWSGQDVKEREKEYKLVKFSDLMG